MAVTIQDLLKDPRYKDNKSLILLAKPDVVPPRRRKKKKQKSKLDRIDERLLSLEEKLDLIIKRLDQHDQLFRDHGWIK